MYGNRCVRIFSCLDQKQQQDRRGGNGMGHSASRYRAWTFFLGSVGDFSRYESDLE